MERLDVAMLANNAGTFRGCVESLNNSFLDFINEHISNIVPGIVLADLPLHTKLSFLRGLAQTFFIKRENGTVRVDCTPPLGGIFSPQAGLLLSNAAELRSRNLFDGEDLYPLVAGFSRIKLRLGSSHILVFNPSSLVSSLLVDKGLATVDGLLHPLFADDAALIVVKPNLLPPDTTAANDNCDMDLCDANTADLIIECLTKRQFNKEHDDGVDRFVGSHANKTHAFVLYYGRSKYIVLLDKKHDNLMRTYFACAPGEEWRTNYFRFRARSVMNRLLHRASTQ